MADLIDIPSKAPADWVYDTDINEIVNTTNAAITEHNTTKQKVDGIEAGATADQTGAEIKAAYEGEADTNAFTDEEKTKLDGIEENATADQTGAEIKAALEASVSESTSLNLITGSQSGLSVSEPIDGYQQVGVKCNDVAGLEIINALKLSLLGADGSGLDIDTNPAGNGVNLKNNTGSGLLITGAQLLELLTASGFGLTINEGDGLISLISPNGAGFQLDNNNFLMSLLDATGAGLYVDSDNGEIEIRLPGGDNKLKIDPTGMYLTNNDGDDMPIKSTRCQLYNAILNQSSTNAPVATELYNDTGEIITWVRGDVGTYYFALSGDYSEKAIFRIAPSISFFNCAVVFHSYITYDAKSDLTMFYIHCFNGFPESTELAVFTDDVINNFSVELKIYNVSQLIL